jgi:hypothetical protein
MKLLLSVLLTGAILSGCKISTEAREAKGKIQGDLRLEIFKECMSLAAEVNKATSQHYNDLDEVVSECSNQAYYMSRQIGG